jgi:hypothetical protein
VRSTRVERCLERRRIDAIDEGGGINFSARHSIHSIAFDRLDD